MRCGYFPSWKVRFSLKDSTLLRYVFIVVKKEEIEILTIDK